MNTGLHIVPTFMSLTLKIIYVDSFVIYCWQLYALSCIDKLHNMLTKQVDHV